MPNKYSGLSGRFLCSTLLASALLTPVAVAQDAPAANSTSWLLEEITVTARKREEGLQSTPIAISAFSGSSLEYRGVTNVGEIAQFTPNLSFQNNPSFGGASNSAAIYIRGVGQKEFLPTVDPGVGLYVDGVYIARSVGGILDLVDVERIEVLKGPQGTLFGRNTIGGAISITTQKPHETLAGKVSATYGSDDRLDLKATVNLPLADNFFAKFSGAYLSQDGYVLRDDGVDLGDDDTLSGRASFLLTPSEDLEINFSFEASRDRENGPALTLIGVNYGNPVDPDTPPMAVIHNVGANLAAGNGPIPCALPNAPLNLAVPGCYDDRYVYDGESRSSGTAPAYSNTDFWAANLNIDWAFSEDISVRSITAYRNLDATFSRDGDHSPHRVSQFQDLLEQEQFTQEVQFLGTALEDQLNWIVGLYYFKETGNNVNELDFTVSRFRSGGTYDNQSLAAFAQGTYDVSDRFHITAGIRYTDEKKKFKPDQIIHENYFAGSMHPQLDAPFMQAGERVLPFLEKELTYDNFDPYLNLSYDVSDDLMAYASYSEGFKSGGFSQRVFPPIVAPYTAPAGTPDIDLIPTFLPEFVRVYELGFKYSGMDGKLRLNGATFYTDYSDMQVQTYTGVAPITKNAGAATIKGAELEMQMTPADGWFIEAGMGYLDAQYDAIDPVTTLISKDKKLERVSDWTFSAAMSKEISLGQNGSLVPRIDWAFRSQFENDAFNTVQIHQGGYHLLNANLTWENADENMTVVFGVKNITDEKYLHTGIIGDAFQSYEGLYDRGRQWYLTARYSF
ncbi:TonB-dependent receptor [Paremcibacter congregatus]|uniref:TonB-dependent receptor n=1 Tax=Paremcibacter congregatus TaxID=2043170 RepID=A0A2G4YQM5_9PROT|nr:TonB-dependent receptor [Paremcibacter congregatus]PHZ84634.1 TonB-dependent receptor [Paremcibacter congregatus]QDE28546.1 TonB-dependent receptor [Paremcibacter congregatus]